MFAGKIVGKTAENQDMGRGPPGEVALKVGDGCPRHLDLGITVVKISFFLFNIHVTIYMVNKTCN